MSGREEDFDARFAEIVRHYGPVARHQRPEPDEDAGSDAGPEPDNGRAGAGTGPVSPAGGPSAPGPPDGAEGTEGAGGAQDDGVDQAPPATWREWTDPDVEEHYVPPPPPPLPAGDLHLWGIVLGLLGGPLVLLLATWSPSFGHPLWTWTGVLLGVGGVVLLVLRLPTRRDDDPSGGARV